MQAIINEILRRGWGFDLHCNQQAYNTYANIYEAGLDPGFIDTGPVYGKDPHEALWNALMVMTKRVEERTTEKAAE